ncbi:uncharacterized protein LOC120336297 [Styela clava]|uniref:uncharacterized protein LOC120336297 n=1 Tax=Styela clava TaxID=7725 RepID=UPI001939531D|nr:uncharacterized protein LOC120336297 [Styela clava]
MVEVCQAKPFDYVRFVFSICLLIFSIVVTSYAIFRGKTGFWEEVPGPAAFALFVVDLAILGIVEGLQIALVELKRQHPDSYKFSHPRAYQLGQVASKKDNVERFLMGRQVFVVFLVFFIAKLTTIDLGDDLNDFLFPVPAWLYYSLLETGFITCILVVIVAQLMPQIVASKYPVHFLNFWLMKPAYWACIAVEFTGITHACWILSYFMGLVSGMESEDLLFQKSRKSFVMSELDPKQGGMSESPQKLIVTTKTHIPSPEHALQEVETILNEAAIEEDNRHIEHHSEKQFEAENMEKFSHLVEALDKGVDPDVRKILQFYLNNHPEKFRTFPSVIGNKVYPPPQALAEELQTSGSEVPGFLRDISDPEHVPPHIVACELLVHIVQLQKEIQQLKANQASGYTPRQSPI